MNILILGPQGSGKGTQAKLLSEKFGLFYFESGNFLRELSKTKPDVGERINRGELIPDEEMLGLVKDFLEKNAPSGQNMLLDGYPRSVVQYENLKGWLESKGSKIDHAILLEISQEESVRRLSARRMDKITGKIYNLVTAPPPPQVNQENLIQREDDKPDAIKVRLDKYQEVTAPLVSQLEKEGILKKVNGERPIDVIFADLQEIVGVGA